MELSGSSSIRVGATATAMQRSNLGIHHLFAACKATNRISVVERQNLGQPFGEFWTDILHDSLVVATSTVSSLESYANELYFEGRFLKDATSPVAADAVGELVSKESALKKYSTALIFKTGKAQETGKSPYQDIEALVRLRNHIVHYRSEWSDSQGTHQKLSKVLHGKFARSPFLGEHEPLFPKAWASHSFACWAIQSVYAFMSDFHKLAGTENPLDSYKSRLQELSGCAL